MEAFDFEFDVILYRWKCANKHGKFHVKRGRSFVKQNAKGFDPMGLERTFLRLRCRHSASILPAGMSLSALLMRALLLLYMYYLMLHASMLTQNDWKLSF